MRAITKLAEQRQIFLSCPQDPRLIAATGKHVQRKGRGPGSLEQEATAGLDYWVLNSSAIQKHCPLLWQAYLDAAAVVSEALGFKVNPMETENGCNINMLVGNGSRYERHVDSTPYTMITYITHEGIHHEGGELITAVGRVHGYAGSAIVFDGSQIEHEVLPIVGTKSNPLPYRISVPMMFTPEGVTAISNDKYLYS